MLVIQLQPLVKSQMTVDLFVRSKQRDLCIHPQQMSQISWKIKYFINDKHKINERLIKIKLYEQKKKNQTNTSVLLILDF